ncbi:MAG: DUF4301 family protein, partial [Desulfobacteraceae bacterium]
MPERPKNMNPNLFSDQDLREIEARGLTEDRVRQQLEILEKGLTSCKLNRPCTPGDGIMLLNQAHEEHLIALYEQAAGQGRAQKFVPASGAATRMFQTLQAARNSLSAAETNPGSTAPHPDHAEMLQGFIRDLPKFAFYAELQTLAKKQNWSLDEPERQKNLLPILDDVLSAPVLNLAQRPKALIPFHVYPDQVRTPLEEQLQEGAAYVRDNRGLVRLHLTVSAEHQDLMTASAKHFSQQQETGDLKFQITFSNQNPATDTLSLDKNRQPLRDAQNRLIWHAGGHGALLSNLNALQGDIVFIKNIDNVAPDRLKPATIRYKKILGGLLVTLQERMFDFLEKLTDNPDNPLNVAQAFRFIREWLSIEMPAAVQQGSEAIQTEFLIDQLHRPLRICGMVRNQGEPGGGPFWIADPDGSVSLQIVESSQVDHTLPDQKAVWQSSTHFNPVDLVCGLRDFKGRPFDLQLFVDHQTGFISRKSHNGVEYRVYEWPGLWNGAMAR